MPNNIIDSFIDKYGEDVVIKQLKKLKIENASQENFLTIVTNSGAHRIPEHLVKGELYIASSGDFDQSNSEIIEKDYEEIIASLSLKLREQNWNKIYLIPFGPTTLNMLIKLVVFRVTYSDTIDYVYTGDGRYIEICINTRSNILDKNL